MPKSRYLPVPPIQRQMVGGPLEQSVISLFDFVHAQRLAQFNDEGEITPSIARNQYIREAKLAAIRYAKVTWKQLPDGNLVPLSKYQAAKNLGITAIMLKNWIGNEQLILSSLKGSRRSYSRRSAKYPAIENPLYTLFEEARVKGRNITHRWFLRHAKSIYCQLYPKRCILNAVSGRWTYLEMKWLNAWF